MSELLAGLDAAVPGRLLVAGALPPGGRDIDLIVRREDRPALAQCLLGLGFRARDHRWVRFDDEEIVVVEVLAAEALGLPARELEALFEEAAPVAGLEHVVEPSATHKLLLLARKRAGHGGSLCEKDGSRIARLLASEPDAWGRASERSYAWRLPSSLRCIHAAATGAAASPRLRAAAYAEALMQRGDGSAIAGMRRVAVRRLAGRRGGVLALSGLDGAGKSTQAAALAAVLSTLGYRTRVVWAPIGSNGPIANIAEAAKRMTGRDRALSPDQHESTVPPGPGGLFVAGWVTLIGIANAAAQTRIRVQVLSGRIVICDRYVLDSAVHLLHRYGDTAVVRTQIRLIELAAPKASWAYFVDVPPEVALQRKTDRWASSHLERRSALYHELQERYGARRIDGGRSSTAITAELAREVWESLP